MAQLPTTTTPKAPNELFVIEHEPAQCGLFYVCSLGTALAKSAASAVAN